MKGGFAGWLGASPILFARRLFSDRTLGLGDDEARLLSSIKISDRSLYGDRFRELRRFWGKRSVECLIFFLRCGVPFSKRLRSTLMAEFEGRTAPGVLMERYQRTAFHYAAFLMLSMHRGQWIAPFVPDVHRRFPSMQGLRVLDYGCGVSDPGLILARMGARVTIADLATARLEFVRWRYAIRGMKCDVLTIEDTERIPALQPAGFGLVMASEVLEHVRFPLVLLRELTAALEPGGLLFCPSGATIERDVGGDHLPEAIATGRCEEYQQFFLAHYSPYAAPNGYQWLFQRRNAKC